jgi:hypothetical protein
MKASLLSFVSVLVAAGLVKAVPVPVTTRYLGLPDDWNAGEPPSREGQDDPKLPKVVAIATKFNGDNRQVLLTKAGHGRKDSEFVRGKAMTHEKGLSHLTANRETHEEGERDLMLASLLFTNSIILRSLPLIPLYSSNRWSSWCGGSRAHCQDTI